jgi:hypothetical protein
LTLGQGEMMPPAEKIDEFQIDHLDLVCLRKSYSFIRILEQLFPPFQG